MKKSIHHNPTKAQNKNEQHVNGSSVETQQMIPREASIEYTELFNDIVQQISHDVRPPLTRILGLANLIENFTLTESEKTLYLNHMVEAAKELDSSIKNIINKDA